MFLFSLNNGVERKRRKQGDCLTVKFGIKCPQFQIYYQHFSHVFNMKDFQLHFFLNNTKIFRSPTIIIYVKNDDY